MGLCKTCQLLQSHQAGSEGAAPQPELRKIIPWSVGLVVSTLDSKKKKSDRFSKDSDVSSTLSFYKKLPFKMKLGVLGIGHLHSSVLLVLKLKPRLGFIIHRAFMAHSCQTHGKFIHFFMDVQLAKANANRTRVQARFNKLASVAIFWDHISVVDWQ